MLTTNPGCPPNPVPSPVSTNGTLTGSGGTLAFAPYADVTGSVTIPANSGTLATVLTLEDGENDYDSFPAPSKAGLTEVFLEIDNNSLTAVTFTGSEPLVLALTSASCFESHHTYFADLDEGGLTLLTSAGVASNDGNTETFSLGAKSFPTGTVQVTVNEGS